MRQSQFYRAFQMSLCLMAVLAVTLACAIPFLPVGKPAASPTPGPAGETGQPPAEMQGPNPTLTQAAATLYAPLEATWTASAGGQPGAQPPAATQAPGVPAPQQPVQGAQPGQGALIPPEQQPQAPLIQPQQPQAPAIQPQPAQPAAPAQGSQPAAREAAQLLSPLPSPTAFWASLASQPGQPAQAAQPQAGQGGLIQPQQPAEPAQPAAPAQGEVPLIRPVQPGAQPTPAEPLPLAPPPDLPQPSQDFTPFPAAGFDVPAGQGFGVLGVNLPVCGGIYTANFLVHNISGTPLESGLIQISDLSAGGGLFGPYTSDAPFGGSDTACTPGGIDSLPSNAGLFIGSSLGAANLSGHTVRVDLRLCTQNGLGGTCYSRAIEFVVP